MFIRYLYMIFYNSYMISYILDNLVVILSAFISYLISILNLVYKELND
jgi:hypothetical protein